MRCCLNCKIPVMGSLCHECARALVVGMAVALFGIIVGWVLGQLGAMIG